MGRRSGVNKTSNSSRDQKWRAEQQKRTEQNQRDGSTWKLGNGQSNQAEVLAISALLFSSLFIPVVNGAQGKFLNKHQAANALTNHNENNLTLTSSSNTTAIMDVADSSNVALPVIASSSHDSNHIQDEKSIAYTDVPNTNLPKSENNKNSKSVYSEFFKKSQSDIPVEAYLTSNKIQYLINYILKDDQDVKIFLDRIKKLIKTMDFNTEIIEALGRTTLKIYVVAEDMIPGNKNNNHVRLKGYYTPKDHIILISYDCKISNDNLEYILRNELHHATIAATNFKKLKTKLSENNRNDIVRPFLTDEGQTSFSDKKLLENAHREFKNNLKQLEDLYNKNQANNLLKAEQQVFEKFIHALENFVPQWEEALWNKENYDKAKRLGYAHSNSDGSVIFSKVLFPNALYDYQVFAVDDNIKGQKDKIKIFFNYDYPKNINGKIEAFLREWNQIISLYDNNDAYGKQGSDKKLLEFASHIDSYDPKIKTAFAEKWCKYFEQYTNINNYCMSSRKL